VIWWPGRAGAGGYFPIKHRRGSGHLGANSAGRQQMGGRFIIGGHYCCRYYLLVALLLVALLGGGTGGDWTVAGWLAG